MQCMMRWGSGVTQQQQQQQDVCARIRDCSPMMRVRAIAIKHPISAACALGMHAAFAA